MKPIIRVKELGKQYRIGVSYSPYPTLRETIGAFQLPFKGRKNRNASSADDKIWALKNINFEVMPGEVVGIIGRNGAGKSTLLKILSRITEPTTGLVELYGRVGSLLEVGTGFHPELTGMENIYLNGAILGMSRREIDSKFDEIVAFAEIEKFLDTPVKRYSSGMYMRLAFAVAAHLEPEILIVDEVLAVGDAAFQKKCIGKMSNVAKRGRTVLFVSHNMAAVRTLCKRGILIDNGAIELDSNVEACITKYLAEHDASDAMKIWHPESAPQTPEIRFTRGYVSNHRGEIVSQLDYRNDFVIALEYEVLKPVRNLRVGFFLQTVDGIPICGSNDPEAWSHIERGPGRYVSKCVFPGSMLNAGTYVVGFGSDSPPGTEALIHSRPSLSFVIEVMEEHGPFNRALPGVIRPKLHWEIEKVAY
jgi:lipopolysaccharide transport system ATP-binding protein